MDTSERRFEDEIEYWLTHVGPSEFDLYGVEVALGV